MVVVVLMVVVVVMVQVGCSKIEVSYLHLNKQEPNIYSKKSNNTI
jgi:hypothetical protein